MEINKILKDEADEYFKKISVNDFYSYTKSDFSNNVLVDLSYEKAIKDAELSEKFIERINYLRAINNYTYDENVILDAAIEFCNYIISNKNYYWNKFTITHNTCPLPYIINALKSYPSNDKKDDDNYFELIAQLPNVLKAMREKLKSQKEQGIILPEDECQISTNMIEGLYQLDNSMLRRKSNSKKIDNIISQFNNEIMYTVNYLKNSYLADESRWKALCEIKNGKEYYDSLIKTYTSYNQTPQQIHKTGIENIRITRNKMQEIIKNLGYNMTIEEFNYHINNDRRFFDRTPAQLFNRMNSYLEKIHPYLKEYFNKQPLTECCVEAIAPSREASTSWGYYAIPVGTEKRGIYYFSGAEIDKRCQIRTGAIVYHELLPGHHFQMNLIAEDDNLPKICNQHFNTAYADGWAEYAVDLSNEMGMFDEYDLYGRYLWDLILSVRLVVDSGVNAFGWSLDKVKKYMKENTTLTDTEIFTEALRYSVDMPGQALAYKMGSIKMHEFRNKSQSILKNKFNIKDYHDTVLKYGSIPLNLLEKNIENYIMYRQ